MPPIYMIIGCPGAGKSWVVGQTGDAYHLVHHDAKLKRTNAQYVREIHDAARSQDRPVICEAPFSVNEILQPLRALGHAVTPLFILEEPQVIAERYRKREGRDIPKGHLTRQETYRKRAVEMGAFYGTSTEVAMMLKSGVRTLELMAPLKAPDGG